MYIKQQVDFEEAKAHIEDGGIVYVTESDRRIGKSINISAYSLWTQKPIVVSSNNIAKNYADIGGIKNLRVLSSGVGLRGHNFRDGLLVDDISEKDYQKLKEIIPQDVEVAGFVREGKQ